jgi:DNA-binding NtrC family response regulator
MISPQAQFLLIEGSHDPYWSSVLAQVLTPLGYLQVGAANDLVVLLQGKIYNIIIIDTTGVEHAPQLIECICAEQPSARIIVMTASPTWTRAREAFLAGAIDYTRKSLNPDEIRSVIWSALNKPLRRPM